MSDTTSNIKSSDFLNASNVSEINDNSESLSSALPSLSLTFKRKQTYFYFRFAHPYLNSYKRINILIKYV